MTARALGQPSDRIDGALKVMGKATYTAEWAPAGLLHGVIVTSLVAAGRIATIDTSAAEAAPGVRLVMTHRNAPKVNAISSRIGSPDKTLALLQDDIVWHQGQPVALVVADSFEQATHAAHLVRVAYVKTEATLTIAAARKAGFAVPVPGKRGLDTRGDPDAALKAAPVRIDLRFTTPIQHHNPMEPHATIASWEAGRLTVYDSHQTVGSDRQKIAAVLGLRQADVRVVTKFVGGAFGTKGSTWSHTPLAAMAARSLGRPVKIVLTRQQMFTVTGYRGMTEQRVALGASQDGKLTAAIHESCNNVSRFDQWNEAPSELTTRLYACPNMRMTHDLVPLNLGTPTFMRGPGESVGSFALESAMDALAHELRLDPIALRVINYAETDPSNAKPFSSKHLRACYAEGARRFGWERRPTAPRSRWDGPLLVGYGMATATYPVRNFKGALARVRMYDEGTVLAENAHTDLGTGSYTAMAQVVADGLALPLDKVRYDLGDSDLPAAGPSGGSMGAGSNSAALFYATRNLRDALISLAVSDAKSPLHGLSPDRVETADEGLRAIGAPDRRDPYATILRRAGRPEISAEGSGDYGNRDYSTHSFGAQFVEVRVDSDFGTVRVVRQLGVFAAGRILNAKLARSQVMGGMIWGASLALLEGTSLDLRSGRYTTKDLAEYLVPVNADVGAVDVLFLEEEDTHIGPLSVKGIGEVGITGVGAAIANAVFNAIGKRVVDLPILPERVL